VSCHSFRVSHHSPKFYSEVELQNEISFERLTHSYPNFCQPTMSCESLVKGAALRNYANKLCRVPPPENKLHRRWLYVNMESVTFSTKWFDLSCANREPILNSGFALGAFQASLNVHVHTEQF
jgi:hypothetical protein